MKNEDSTKLIEVYDGTAWQAGIVISMLNDAGINAFLKDAILGTLNPWWAAPGGAGAVKIIVAESDAENAMQVVEEFEKNSKSE
jgi:hypothetical protein